MFAETKKSSFRSRKKCKITLHACKQNRVIFMVEFRVGCTSLGENVTSSFAMLVNNFKTSSKVPPFRRSLRKGALVGLVPTVSVKCSLP